MNLNYVILIGNVGKPPVLRKTRKNVPVTNFSIATTERRNNGSSITQWHNVVAWAKNAEYSTKIKTGDLVLIVGNVINHSRESEGFKFQTSEIKAIRILILKPKQPPTEE
jgi:single-strand DNA-binding protein